MRRLFGSPSRQRSPSRRGWLAASLTLGVAVSMIAAVGGQAGASRADWPQLGRGSEHTGYHPFERDVSPATVPGFAKLWQRDLTPKPDPSLRQVYAGSVVAQGLVFAAPMKSSPWDGGSHTTLWALDARTGEPVWKTTDLGWLVATPAVSRGVVVVNASNPFQAVAFDAETGETLWRHRTTFGATEGENFQGAAPVIAHGTAIVSTTGDSFEGAQVGRLWAFDVETGDVVWMRHQSWARPAIAGGVVYASRGSWSPDEGSDGRPLVALDLRSGSARWRAGLGPHGTMIGAPAVAGGVVYTTVWRPGRGATMVALSARNGHVRWREPCAHVILGAPPVVAPDRIMAETAHGSLLALRRSDGEYLWLAQIDPRSRHVTTCVEGACASPAAANGVVFAIAGDRIRAFRLFNGEPLWSRGIGDPTDDTFGITSSPAISRGTVFVGSDTGHLFAFSQR